MLAEKVGAKIRLLRQAKNYSQENLAEQLGMSPSGYAKIERGETDLSLSRIEQISKVFGVSALEILDIGGNHFHNHGTTNGNTFYGDVHLSNGKRLDSLEQQLADLRALVEQVLKK
jgi:transcriptional regulator with XRE-family HTH domain